MNSGRLALAGLLLLVACDHRPEDFAGAREEAQEFQASWGQRIDGLNSLIDQMARRAASIPAGTPGLDDLNKAIAGAKSQLDALGPKVNAASDGASAQLAGHHRKLAGETLARASAELKAGVDAVATTLNDLGPRLDAVAAAGSKPPPPPVALAITDPGFARAQSVADIDGIAFKSGTADLDLAVASSKPALDSIVEFAKSCDQLRFAIVGHTAKDGDAAVNQRLSEAQAQTVQAYLVAGGIDAAKVVQVQGVGGSQPLVAEPEPGSPEEAAMATADLSEIRAKNRRVTVLVTEPCP